ncbi:MAG: NAD(P)-dependent oxidoreductase [Hyphomicrobium sp.]|jgi:nucleoside-diphosphate-sugar epimerase
MTILVTGATGLVGERLVPRLLEAGIDCRVLVRAGRTAPPGAAAVEGELFDAASLARAVEGVSAVVHLAAAFRTMDDEFIWKSNLEGTRNLIAATKSVSPHARFIMASTSNIYDADAPRPGREDDAAHPKHAYPASKLAAEEELRGSELTWSVLRFAFVYGENDGHLESMAKLAAGGMKLQPAARMSMVHHSDIANAVKLALSGALDRHVVNIADDAPTSIYELFKLIGAAIEPSAEPLRNPWHLHVDNSLARQLGFKPRVRTVFQAAQQSLL